MKGKVIVVTGAASGMGLEVAKLLASKGAKVSLSDVQEEPLKAAVAEITAAGGQAMGTMVDVRDRKAVEAWIAATVAAYGPLDGAANMAGVISRFANVAGIDQIDDDDWDFVMGVNAKGLMNCMRAQIPHFNEKGASIVNAASVAGLMGFARNALYSASKHAAVGLTKSAAKELGPKNIRVNCICPGPIDTPMLRKSAGIRGGEMKLDMIALGRRGEPIEVAQHVSWLLSDESSYISGGVQTIDGGWVC